MTIRSFSQTAAVSILILTSLAACEFQKQADSKFGDQHFKTAIALIELHNTRYGTYPESLKDLKHLGDWDGIAIPSVAYKRLANGYELNLTRGWVDKPTLSYPADFWIGLGIKSSNVAGAPKVTPGT